MAESLDPTPPDLRPRIRPVQARALRSRRRVLDAAHALLKAEGPHRLTTAAIAAASGVSVGALYRFFPNKESIICQLYEEKLDQIRRAALDERAAGARALSWRDYFRDTFRAMKAAERQVDFDFSLADALFLLPQLWAIDARHGVTLADRLVADMKRLGSNWSDAALFDLALNVYALDSATWMVWRYAQRHPAVAIERMIEASLVLMRPAMEGDPEPSEIAVSREEVLASL